MTKTTMLYRVQFICNGEQYELYVRELIQGNLFGFIEIGDFVWDTHTNLVVDPSHERLKDEFADVNRTYIPMHSVIRIDAVEKEGSAKIKALGKNVSSFPSPIYTNPNNTK